ncbi:MAG: hypothetical protein CBB68_06015 [Rhodospirillaceae bacterium TMED8]|nr:hypothetical protein [Magnetovibrio sp.]OUT51181.1 MAG: hypothetical protein CBB68_06015 [Rhodospirillaceae bacterium TMED8]|tara:strand:+ start:985 stop:1182 length:198 start_codon:yes stop_codon:yes gene_type:complete
MPPIAAVAQKNPAQRLSITVRAQAKREPSPTRRRLNGADIVFTTWVPEKQKPLTIHSIADLYFVS